MVSDSVASIGYSVFCECPPELTLMILRAGYVSGWAESNGVKFEYTDS